MNSIKYSYIPILLLFFSLCTIDRNNPLDENGDSYTYPFVKIDSTKSGILGDDTITSNSVNLVLIGNRNESIFRINIDNSEWTSWSSTKIFTFDSLNRGRHFVKLETKYEGGNIVTSELISFVIVLPTQPNDSQNTNKDNTGPSIEQLSGPHSLNRVVSAKQSFSFRILDSSGVQSVFIKVNGQNETQLTSTNSIYQTDITLPLFGYDTIKIVAKDNSPLKNESYHQIILNHNSVPDSLYAVSPISGAIGVDNRNGVGISWGGGIDKDGDSVKYIIKYGIDTSKLQTIETFNHTAKLIGLPNNSSVNWTIFVTTKLDTIRYPNTGFFTFKTADSSSPTIDLIQGSENASRVLTSDGSYTFEISDIDGIDTAYFTINNIFSGNLIRSTGNFYTFNYSLKQYGLNQLAIIARDRSLPSKESVFNITLNFNTKPSPITQATAENKMDGLGHSKIMIKWNKSIDLDGDSISYKLFYGLNSLNMNTIYTNRDSIELVELQGGSVYKWFLVLITALDTLRYPVQADSTLTFITQKIPPKIISFIDKKATINDSLVITVSSTSSYGIKEYRWDFQGDGNWDKVTTNNSVMFSYSIVNIFKCIVEVVDSLGSSVRDTSLISITNDKPKPNAIVDSIIGLNGLLHLSGSGSIDDGKITKYEWRMLPSNKLITSNKEDTTIILSVQNLPRRDTCILKVFDDDGNFNSDTSFINIDMIWKCATKNPGFSLRTGSSVLVFDNKMWIIGGQSIGNRSALNDIWNTSDGITWKRVVTSANFAARYGHACNVFDDGAGPKIFLTGGTADYAGKERADVWSSADGVTWKLVNDSASFGPRMNHVLLNYNGFLYILNAGPGNRFGTCDVWRSANGINWELRPNYSNFSIRYTSGVVYSGKIIMAGGNDPDETALSSVYQFNGNSWEQLNSGFEPHSGFGLVEFGNKLWALGSEDGTNGSKAIQYTEDGIFWKTATNHNPFGNQSQQATFFNGKMWVINETGVWCTDDQP